MPDDPQRPDNLDHDRTFVGEREKASGDTQSLGDDATRGDAGNASRDDFKQALEVFDEVVDLEKRYDIQGELGAGGMGSVLKAVDKRLGRTVALKFLLEELGDSAQALRRFMTEAKAIAMLNHNNIVQIYEMERSAEGPFIVMEYVQGGSLVDLLGDGPLDQETAVDIICQVCDALGIAHDQDIIHRDVKPANILMTTDGVPKLSDFGLARQTTSDHGQTEVGTVLGTIDFMPPEQRQDATAVDARSDLWSLAATLYQLVTGRSPKVIRLDLVDSSLRPILAQALEEAQDDRYQSAAEFRDALRASLQAADSGMMIDVDLGIGECPACHVKNDINVKFCRGCGESLRVTCLSCEQPISVWDNFCTDCSGNQKELLITCREEVDSKRTRAETLSTELAFDKALAIAGEIADIQDTRLQHLTEWSAAFIEETTAEKERQRQHAADRDLEAIKHRDAYDYRSAIHALETIPEAMRTKDISSRLTQLEFDHEESEKLLGQIRARIKDKELEGLLDLVNQAVKLRGDREDLQALQVKLLDREEKIARQRDIDAEEEGERHRLPPTPDTAAVQEWPRSMIPSGTKHADEYMAAIESLGTDNYVQCPSCGAAVKAKNLIRHFNKTHKGNLPSVHRVSRLNPVSDLKSLTSSQSTGSKPHDWVEFVTIIGFVAIPCVFFSVGGWYTWGLIILLTVIGSIADRFNRKTDNDFVSSFFALFFMSIAYLVAVMFVGSIWSLFF